MILLLKVSNYVQSQIQQRHTLTNTSKIIANYLRPLSKSQCIISDTLKFPEVVSYDVESLFTSTPIAETTEYILKRTYTNKELKPLCKKSIFKKLLIKLIKKSFLSANNHQIKQIDGCPNRGPIMTYINCIYIISNISN